MHYDVIHLKVTNNVTNNNQNLSELTKIAVKQSKNIFIIN
jgi:hypothetical protein